MEIDLTGNDDSATHASTGFDDADGYTAEREARTSAHRRVRLVDCPDRLLAC